MSFAHLHVHTEYSLLDGFSNIKKLVHRVKEMGMSSVAITDHGTMFGVIEFYQQARDAGIKPIIGIETYVSARGMTDRDPQKDKHSSHLVLLAKNQVGYKNLLKIASAAQLEGYYYYPRVDHQFLETHAEGLIATTSCISGEVPRAIRNGGVEAGRVMLDWYVSTFGVENIYIELQEHEIPELPAINRSLVELSKHYNLKTIATNDVHYIEPSDERLQDIMLAIQTGALISDKNRMRMSGKTYYLRSPEEMSRLFAEVPESLSNTLEVAERCEVDLIDGKHHLPQFEVPDGFTPETYLGKLCEEGLLQKYSAHPADPQVRERLEYELGIIHKMKFDPYFLIVWDLCRFAAENNIWYNTRGSGAGSIVAYALNITLIDPLEHKLLFERFLNPDRISMPDIDLDFQDDKRAMVLEYCAGRYGSDKVAQIITFGTLGARAAIRDVGRVMDIPLSEVNRISKAVPLAIPDETVTIPKALEKCPEFKTIYDEGGYISSLIDTAAQMEGVARNAGTHAAGVVITDVPLLEYLPLHRPTSNALESPIKSVTQFEMNIITDLGLLKVDFLGLATLTIMQRACDFIRERHGVQLNLHNIPLNDPETFAFLGRGHTAGVFQLEGSGMTRWITQMKPKNLDNIIAMVALFRPGPMKWIPDYVKRMHGEEAVTYKHESLEHVFKDTYGIPIYQEQLMLAVIDIAGYKPSEADDLRAAISKKKKESIAKHRVKFITGAQAYGIDKRTAEEIFTEWEDFARYGFNKSHAADYGVIAVMTGYLKLHYAVEYMTALLSVTKSEMEKVAFYVADARSMGIEVLPPDVNTSGWDFTIEDCQEGKFAIRFGMGAVKNVGEAPVDMIMAARETGRFKDLNDFIQRVDLHKFGKRSLESLVRVGALDAFGSRGSLLEAVEAMIAVSASHFRAAESGQMSIFGGSTGMEEEIHLPEGSLLDKRQQLEWEKELIGLYVSDHPLTPLLPLIRQRITHFSKELAETRKGQKVTVAGIVTRIRTATTKKGNQMAFATIEDIQGPIELVIFPKPWESYAPHIQLDAILQVDGKIDSEESDPKILVDSAKLLKEEGAPASGDGESWFPPGGPDVGDPWQGDIETNQYLQQEEVPPSPGSAPVWEEPPQPQPEGLIAEPGPAPDPLVQPLTQSPPPGEDLNRPPAIVSPVRLVAGGARKSSIRLLTVILKASGEREKDARRMKRVHGVLNSYPGQDRFCFMLYERGLRHLLDFPNNTTHVNDELLVRLEKEVGRDNIQIENI